MHGVGYRRSVLAPVAEPSLLLTLEGFLDPPSPPPKNPPRSFVIASGSW